MDCSPPGSCIHGDSPGKNTGVGFHTLLQGIFPTQGSNPGLPCGRQILYHLSHQGSPWILKWIAYAFTVQGILLAEYWSGQPFPYPGDLPNPGIEPRCPALQVDSLPSEPPGKPKNTGVGRPALLQNPGIKVKSPSLQVDSLPAELPGKPQNYHMIQQFCFLVFIWRQKKKPIN